ncbi:saccharopine dehydrogenase-like oxidoreductase [Eurosta solidaginis]|uniref:saccharopine dehydrogenase-like oxidoreductase n=1 Tax=Eurosta solidaginis TaxID=178769 RepID=UPI0035310959
MTTKLDAIIFGATGFTGKVTVEHAVEVVQGLRWGIAGRNLSKLENVLKEVGKKVDKDLSDIPIIIANVGDEKSIKEMASKCKVIVNCCGPYRFYGEVVVKACIEAGTHHVDVSGEPQFIDGMILKYNDLAKEKRVYVISAVGFDSIPGEMGVVHAEENFPGTVNSIESYWENDVKYIEGHSKAFVHSGTWESAVYILSHAKEHQALQKQIKPKDFPKLKPALKARLYPHKVPSLESYFLPMKGGDRDIVHKTQYLWHTNEQKRPIQFENYLGFKSLFYTILVPIIVALIFLLAQFSLTRKMLIKFPSIFTLGFITHAGPTEATMRAQYFQMTFKTKGWARGQSLNTKPKLQLWTRVSGYNPFYALTGMAMLASAKIILQETDKLPGSGGVISPGYAFAKTSLIEELQKYKCNMKFEVLKLEQ